MVIENRFQKHGCTTCKMKHTAKPAIQSKQTLMLGELTCLSSNNTCLVSSIRFLFTCLMATRFPCVIKGQRMFSAHNTRRNSHGVSDNNPWQINNRSHNSDKHLHPTCFLTVFLCDHMQHRWILFMLKFLLSYCYVFPFLSLNDIVLLETLTFLVCYHLFIFNHIEMSWLIETAEEGIMNSKAYGNLHRHLVKCHMIIMIINASICTHYLVLDVCGAGLYLVNVLTLSRVLLQHVVYNAP